MEEDIKILEGLIFELKSFSLDIEGFKRAQAIENLIVKYKELEENLNFKQKELNKLYDTEEKFIDDFYIPKSKVIEKIKELEDGTYDAKIILQQLLKD